MFLLPWPRPGPDSTNWLTESWELQVDNEMLCATKSVIAQLNLTVVNQETQCTALKSY